MGLKGDYMSITNEDWIEYRNNATKYLEQNSQYATRKAVQDAIDKQIEVKAFKIKDTNSVICPICHAIAFDSNLWIKNGYCFRCGQKLKWN